MSRWMHTFFVAALLTAAPGLSVIAADASIDWTLANTSIRGARGEIVKVTLTGAIPDGWHTYSLKTYEGDLHPLPTVVTAGPETLLKIGGTIQASKPLVKFDKGGFDIDVEIYENSVSFEIPLLIDRSALPGEHSGSVTVVSQLCQEHGSCLMPKTVIKEFQLTITDGPVKNDAAVIPPPATVEGSVEDIAAAKSKGILDYLWLSMTTGALALLTPCVFPMIPITVSFFTKRKHVSRARSIRDAAIFSLGIVFTFTLIGFFFALVFGATGITRFAANPIVNLGFAAVFLILALNLFGVFEIQIPSFVLNKLNASANQGEGIGSVLLMGLVFSLTSFTCTVPFIGASLSSATQGDWFWPVVGMIGFSAVFASPFFVLALVPAALKSLPKSGGWLNSVKVVMGFLEVAAAMKFISNTDLASHWGFLSREVFLSIWVAIAILTTLYLLGFFQLSHDTPVEKIGGMRVIFSISFLSLGIWLGTGLMGAKLSPVLEAYLPPVKDELSWLIDYDAAAAESRHTGMPIFADFTGWTCTNCRYMEKNIFPNPQVNELLKKFVRVRMYTDDQKEIERSHRYQQMEEERFKTSALPYYAVFSPDEKTIAKFDGMTADSEKFASFLSAAIAKSAENISVARQ